MMAIKYHNNWGRLRKRIKKSMVEVLNEGANAHQVFSELTVPIDTGRLRESIRVSQRATEENPQAIVEAGGIEIRGERVDYAHFVEFGHATRNGGWVPADPFFVPGIELAMQRIKQEGRNALANLTGHYGPQATFFNS